MQPINTVNPTIYLAIELSASTWLIAVRLPGSEKPHLHRIEGGDTAALFALISSLRARVARRLDAAIAKRIHRERENLVQEKLRIENRIEALLFTQGIRKRPSLRSWEHDLAFLRTGDGREMPRHLRAELDRLRRRL